MKIFNEKGEPTRELFFFLRHNQVLSAVDKLSEKDEGLYEEFIKKWFLLKSALEEDRSSSSTILGSIMSLFGFNRHYCSMTGKAIIGKYFKLAGKIVSPEAYESYRIIQEMESKEEFPRPKKNIEDKNIKTMNKGVRNAPK